jgi:hypothetical protein
MKETLVINVSRSLVSVSPSDRNVADFYAEGTEAALDEIIDQRHHGR